MLNDVFSALFFFDYSLTSREVEYIWKRKFSTPTVLFYLVRYLGLFTTIFSVMEVTGWTGRSAKVHVACHRLQLENDCQILTHTFSC